MTNKLDPRVDSDRDNRNDPSSRVGGYGAQESYGTTGGMNPAPSSGGYGHTSGDYGQTGTGLSQTAGTTGPVSGSHGTHSHGTAPIHHSTTTGATGAGGYGSNEYGSGNYGSNEYGSSETPGSGNTNKTAGPHNSNLLNKLDPRVDSDLDGSKRVGQDQTYR